MAIIETKGITVELGWQLDPATNLSVLAWATDCDTGKNNNKPGIVINVHDDNGCLFEVKLTEGALFRGYMASLGVAEDDG